eukprot:15008484-Alexandrium_andersonii.AAC.1
MRACLPFPESFWQSDPSPLTCGINGSSGGIERASCHVKRAATTRATTLTCVASVRLQPPATQALMSTG